MYAAKFALGATGRPTVIDTGATAVTGPAINGGTYNATYSALYVTTEAVDASDTNIGGFRYRKDGALRVSDATAGLPANTHVNQGVALTTNGQACYTTTVNTTVAGSYFNVNGVALDVDSIIYANLLSFALEFADLGAGVVSTVEAIGAATPTFTRATTATTVLSTGLIGAVASGDPRSYYDPTTLEYLGYLAEGARTNLCLQSEDFSNAAWTNAFSTDDADTAVSPDGNTTADTITATAANGYIFPSDTGMFAAAGGGTYTYSVFVKDIDAGSFSLLLGATANYNATFNLSTLVISGLSANTTATIVPYGNGWFRATLTAAAVANAVYAEVQIGRLTDGTSVYIWGGQLELGTFASSYIPTTTLAVARNADVLTYPTTWLNAAVGTLLASARTSQLTAAIRIIFAIDDGTANELVQLQTSASDQPQLQVTDGGVSQATVGATALTANTSFKVAGAYVANDFAECMNGGTVNTDAAGTLPTITTVGIGCTSAGGSQWFGSIARVTYYGSRLANAELQAITT